MRLRSSAKFWTSFAVTGVMVSVPLAWAVILSGLPTLAAGIYGGWVGGALYLMWRPLVSPKPARQVAHADSPGPSLAALQTLVSMQSPAGRVAA